MKRWLPYIAVMLFALVVLRVDFKEHKWKRNTVLNFDTYGYHNYLPAFFIYRDIKHYTFLDSIEPKYKPTHNHFFKYGLNVVEKTGYRCNQYPMGVAVFQAPLFFAAHLWCTFTGQYPADGYSAPYQHAVVFSTLLFAILALLLLIHFLKNYVSNPAIFFTIFILGFGTNFFEYASLSSGFSHAYVFFLYAAILYLSDRWYKKATFINSVFIGLCIGLAAITRPIDILICLIPLLWQPMHASKLNYLKEHWKKILIIIAVTFFTILPQLFYWHTITGSWIYFSYTHDYFQFSQFRVFQGLFSYRKGWFVYTPVALIACLSILLIRKNHNGFFYKKLSLIFLIPMVYLVFSWNNWYYGWSFSCRALVNILPVLALPLAILIERMFEWNTTRKLLLSTIFIWCIFLNLFQTWQYKKMILHGTLMNETVYWRIFLRTKYDENNQKIFELQKSIDWEDEQHPVNR